MYIIGNFWKGYVVKVILVLVTEVNLIAFIFHTFGGFWLSIQVVSTPTHLAIVMEYAARGELYKHIRRAGRFSEDDVSFGMKSDSRLV